MGKLYFDMGRSNEAIKEYGEAIRLKPDYAFYYYAIGKAYFEIGLLEKSIDALKESLKLNPGDERSVRALVNAYIRAERIDDAIVVYSRCNLSISWQ